uniref:Uncharacterized protein n=1 Tax=Romanomermis culicivorax TaxID=13658 RepID=A0A915IE58_ROMCU
MLNEHWLRPCLSPEVESSVIFLNHDERATFNNGGQIYNEFECDIVGRLIEAFLEVRITKRETSPTESQVDMHADFFTISFSYCGDEI